MPQAFAPTDFEPLDTSDFEPIGGGGKTLSPSGPTRFDKFVKGATGNILAPPTSPGEDPLTRIVGGVGDSLGRTTQAWHDMFTGNASPVTAAEMVPWIGPWAVDTGKMLGTPGQRWEGAGSAMSGIAPFATHAIPEIGVPSLSEEAGKRVSAGVKAAVPDVAKGTGKLLAGGIASRLLPHEAQIALGYPLYQGAKQIGQGISKGYEAFKGELPPEPATPPEPWQPNKVNPAIAKKMRYGGSENQYGGSGYRNPGSRGGSGGGGTAPANPNIVGAPPTAAAVPVPPSAPGEGPSVAPGQTPIRQHETNVKVDQQITNKVNNLADYLRSKGGTPEHLDQIVQDSGLTRQYLNEAHNYGVSRGTPVPKTGYKGLDPGSDSYKAIRQRIIDLIEEEKNKP